MKLCLFCSLESYYEKEKPRKTKTPPRERLPARPRPPQASGLDPLEGPPVEPPFGSAAGSGGRQPRPQSVRESLLTHLPLPALRVQLLTPPPEATGGPAAFYWFHP